MRSLFTIAILILVALSVHASTTNSKPKTGKRTATFAIFAMCAYKATDNNSTSYNSISRELRIFATKYPELNLLDWTVIPKTKYLYALKNDKTKELAVVFKGTTITHLSDLWNGGKLISGQLPPRVTEGIAFIEALSKKNVDYKVTVTGHSLGGALAEITATKLSTKVKCYGFSSGGNPWKDSLKVDNIKSFYVTGDRWSSNLGGRRIVIKKVDGINAHSMEHYLKRYSLGELPDRL